MAQDKKTFVFYSDWINMVREMPNEEAGMLLKHVLSYVNDENPETDNLLVKMAFGHMKPTLKKDLKKWEEIREKRKEAGAKGGKANAKQMLSKPKQLEAVNDNVNVNSINTISLTEENFKEFEMYVKQLTGENYRIEGYYRTYGLKKGSLTRLTSLFIEHLKMFPKHHNNYNSFIRHFGSWLGLQDRNGQLNNFKEKVKGQL